MFVSHTQDWLEIMGLPFDKAFKVMKQNHASWNVTCSFGLLNWTMIVISTYKYIESGPEVIKLFTCSTQLSMELKFLINTEIAHPI